MKRNQRNLRRCLSRCIAFIMIFALAGALFRPLRAMPAQAAVTQESRGFQIYLANFLMNDPRIRSDLSCQMLHHLLLQAIENDRTGDLIDFQELVYLQQFLTDRKYRMDGWDNLLLEWPKKTIVLESLYQEVILEILYKQVTDNHQMEQQRKEAIKRRSELLEIIGQTLDWGEDFVGNDSVSRALLQSALPQISDALKEKLRMSAGESMSLSVVSSLLAVADNVLDFVDSLALYYTLFDYNRGNLELLRTMYRQTQDVELMRALKSVINSLELITDQDMLRIVEKEKEEFTQGIASLALDTIFLACMGEAGLIAQTVSSLTNLTLNNQEIGSLYLMLLAQSGVEEALLKAVRYHWNQYSGLYDQAVTLNAGLKLMYDTYEYGNDLAAAYAKAVLDDGLWNKLMNLIRGGNQASEAFEGYVRTWQGVIDTGRTVFDTAWELYLEEDTSIYTDFWEEAPVLVDGVRFTSEEPVIELSDNSPHFVRAVVSPSNAENRKVTYHSMNENVVKVDLSTGLLTIVGPGMATIYAETDEGGYRASQTAHIIAPEEATPSETNGEDSQTELPEEEVVPESCYTENEDGITLVQYFEYKKDGIPGDKTWHVPEMINGRPVTELSLSQQPLNLDGMTVICPKTLLRIDDQCFQYSKLSEIRLNEGVVSIGEKAFYHCWNLKQIEFPATLMKIGAHAFENTSLREVTLPAGLQEMGEDVFRMCYQLNAAVLSDGLEKLGDGAFRDCEQLRTICFPDSLTEIGTSAFEGCSSLVIHDLTQALSLERIGNRGFFGCDGIQELILPDSLVQIGEYAFSDCDRLRRAELPDTLSRIDRYAFGSCDTLSHVVCRSVSGEGSGMQGVVGENAFANCPALSLLELPAAIQILEKDIVKNTPRLELLYWPDTLCAVAEQARCRHEEIPGNAGDYTALEIRVKDGIVGGAVQVQSLPDYLFICLEKLSTGNSSLLGDGNTIPLLTGNPLLSYVELPSALARELPMDTLGVMAQSGLIRLTADTQIETVAAGRKYDSWEDFHGTGLESVSCKNEQGQTVVLYQKPEVSPYQKRSKGAQENPQDYEKPFGEELIPIADQSVSGMRVRVNGDTDTAAGLTGGLTVFGWIEESPESRVHDLEEFWGFEDIYLRQEDYFYCRIGAKDEKGGVRFTLPGRYQLIFRVPDGFSRKDTALYHIGTDGIITRIAGELREGAEGTEFCAEVSDIGSYALVSLERMEITVENSWIEELHDQYNESSRPVTNQPLGFQIEDSSVSVWIPEQETTADSEDNSVKEDGAHSSKITISRPSLSQAYQELGSLFDIQENGKTPEEVPVDESVSSGQAAEDEFRDFVGFPDSFAGYLRIDAAKTAEEICFLVSGGNMSMDFYRLDMDEAGSRTLTAVKTDINEDTNTQDVIYQAALEQEGCYYVVFTAQEDDTKSSDTSELNVFGLKIPVWGYRIGGVLLLLLLIWILSKKKKRRKRS